jgi:hypothetical protein
MGDIKPSDPTCVAAGDRWQRPSGNEHVGRIEPTMTIGGVRFIPDASSVHVDVFFRC